MRQFTRRRLLQYGAGGTAGALLCKFGTAAAPAHGPAGALDPTTIPKFRSPLVVPPAMPLTATIGGATDFYAIAVVQFRQQVLPVGLPRTTVWSYQLRNDRSTRNYPAFTIEANAGRPLRVKWINGLVDASGRFLPHLLAIDPTLHWANPPGGVTGRDSRPGFARTPGPYRGPVPIVTHLHGGHNREESDGYAEAWYLPAARDIPAGFATVGSFYDEFKAKFAAATGEVWEPGTATFEYENDQPASTLWFHDHSLGITRVNVYAGPAGFYLIRGGPNDLPAGVLPGPAPARGDPPRTRYHEIPLAIQDRSFNADGSFAYPGSRALFDGFEGPYVPDSDVPPIWNPEVFGNAMLVNGRTWPCLEVEPRRYRLRILNGCDARFLILRFDHPDVCFWQIGAEGGFLPRPVRLGQLLIAPAERADVIVDFSKLAQRTIRLLNVGPDEPFGGGMPGVDFEPADPATTGEIMQVRVTLPLSGADTSTPPDELTLLPAPPKPGPATRTRHVSLNEAASRFPGFDGPVAALLGTMDGEPTPLRWEDPITEVVATGAVEEWALHNFTEDAHPIHIHEVQFEVVGRESFEHPGARGPEPWETGLKDTVVAYPDAVTRVKALFDRSGRFVWHCHILEHEDNTMMRPYLVAP